LDKDKQHDQSVYYGSDAAILNEEGKSQENVLWPFVAISVWPIQADTSIYSLWQF